MLQRIQYFIYPKTLKWTERRIKSRFNKINYDTHCTVKEYPMEDELKHTDNQAYI